jgi:hypothetical protein
MTTITYLHGNGRSRASNHSILQLAAAPFRTLRDEWRRRETEKLLEALPADIRKDIGWPANEPRSTTR